ncbi:MAG TPA: ATP-binding cassette domain-containing protein, partial [Solirubrobacteraceae bacterium]
MLEVRDLVKHYHVGDGEPVRAVDGVSLSTAAGELVALYGPSGSGKTTLLTLIAALARADAGRVAVDGQDLAALSDAEQSRYRLRDLGFVDQTVDLLPGGSVVQNAALKLWMIENTRKAEQRVIPLLERLGLGQRLRHRADQLSMGERQRVMIARALSTGPKLVLADEPTG